MITQVADVGGIYAIERKSGKRNLSRWLLWFAVKNTHTHAEILSSKKNFRQTELEEIIKRKKDNSWHFWGGSD
jgi:hypothetical protein